MSFKSTIVAGMAAISLTAAASPALAISVAYVTEVDPWGVSTNEQALDAAFGAANWTRLNSFENSIFAGGYDFIFVDGGDGNSGFADWLNLEGGAAAAEAYVLGGGALFLNAAQNYGGSTIATGFGSSLNYPAFDSGVAITAAGVAAGLDVGAGLNFTGTSFAHNNVTVGPLTSLIEGPAGVVLADGFFGLGHLTVGGQTTTNFHSGDNPFQLRVNELQYASTVPAVTGGVPEPATWAMMLIGFFGMGSMVRRRKTALA